MLTLLHFCFSYKTSQFLSCLQDLSGTFSHGKPQLCDYWTIYSSGAEANATLSAGIDSMGIKTRTNALQWCPLKDFKRYFKATRLLRGFLQPRWKTPNVTLWRIKWIMRHTAKFMLPSLYTCPICKAELFFHLNTLRWCKLRCRNPNSSRDCPNLSTNPCLHSDRLTVLTHGFPVSNLPHTLTLNPF